MTVGGDDGLGGNAPNDAAIGVTSYTTNNGLQNEAPMNYPRWYPTGTTMPNGDIVVQGGSLRGGPGGPGVLTPEIYTPDEGSGWQPARRRHQLGRVRRRRQRPRGPGREPLVVPARVRGSGAAATCSTSAAPRCSSSTRRQRGDGELTLRGTLPADGRQPGRARQPGRRDVDGDHVPARQDPAGRRRLVGQRWRPGGRPRRLHRRHHRRHRRRRSSTTTEPMEYQRHWAHLDRPARRRRARDRRQPGEQRQRRLRDQPGDLGPGDR